MILVRWVTPDDLPVVAEMMHHALDPYYGGNHRAHAKRIVETASRGTKDLKGHFSAAQLMYVAVEDGDILDDLFTDEEIEELYNKPSDPADRSRQDAFHIS